MHRVLLVEDDPEFQKHIVRILGETCLVTLAGSIREARLNLEKSEFQLILLDVGLPDGDGYKLCSLIQQDERLAGIPVIFLTGRGEIDDKLLAFSAGADDYITKPFHGNELRARVLARITKSASRQQTGREFRRGDLRFC